MTCQLPVAVAPDWVSDKRMVSVPPPASSENVPAQFPAMFSPDGLVADPPHPDSEIKSKTTQVCFNVGISSLNLPDEVRRTVDVGPAFLASLQRHGRLLPFSVARAD
jgi:hypothetical protein